MARRVCLRDLQEADLPELFEHQRDPVASKMAAFPPRDHAAFMVHWRGILADSKVIKRTILVEAEVVGYIVCYEQSGKMLLGYWLGRDFWGHGIASRAVADFVASISARPLQAYVAKQNLASMRVLEKAGFQVSGHRRAPAATGGEAEEEFIYSLY